MRVRTSFRSVLVGDEQLTWALSLYTCHIIITVSPSCGLRYACCKFFGAFYMSNTTDVELAGLDGDKAVFMEFKA